MSGPVPLKKEVLDLVSAAAPDVRPIGIRATQMWQLLEYIP